MRKFFVILVFLSLFMDMYAPMENKSKGKVYIDIYRMREFKREMRRQAELLIQTSFLILTIHEMESGGRYHIPGGSGEYGAYQFMPNTWRLYSIAHFGEVLDIKNPEHQDMVARAKIRSLLEKGRTIEEIAAIWNSGHHVGWERKVGINAWGQSFNVPNYVRNFKATYEGIVEKESRELTI